MSSPIRITPTSYEQDGIVYDRITTVIQATWPNPELQDWRATVGKARANRELRHAEHIGQLADTVITSILKHGTPFPLRPMGVEIRQVLRGFKEWHGLNAITPVSLQNPLLDPIRLIGGTPDCLTAQEGFDWKTSARFNLTHLLQIDQYWRLAEAKGMSLEHYRLVRFDKILGTWEELILEPNGISWNGVWITREFLGEIFDTLLTLYRQWRYTMGRSGTLSPSSNETITEAAERVAEHRRNR